MTKSKNSTNAGRRAFLSNAASVAAVTVAASIARPAAAVALGPDPIFAAIEAHKAACVTTRKTLDVHSALDHELPADKCRSRATAFGETLVATDDPRWIESERDVMRSFDAETDAACALVSVRPTTIAGVLALLQYANAADTDGEAWPRDLQSDDGTKARSWHYFLIEALAEVLPGMVSA
ncbi:hypothetical protein [Bradyrhizobium erythrophlei]|uniref:Uncharacterized protein n=1 Tax=Bradyrhizobium erythrophlei TaxID=1437360 RepID=A0A1M5UIN2_9BRAD|nr:hypothetical protein [Bradyrhizobium erythrophlei]SHH62758.1 hypothetical protein SAMN05443248_5458 [Bradyrhizobium erythrophlei]